MVRKKKNICIKGINFALIMYLLVMGIGVDLKTDYQPRKAVAATHVAIQNWSLYGRKNKVIYCNDSCTYWDRFKDMAKVWNAHKSGVLKQWKNGDIVTCRVQSAAELSSRSARTYSTGFIVFNTNQMRRHSQNEKNNVALHEQGHALGLDHNIGGKDVMYMQPTCLVKLSQNDKASFNKAYNKFVLGR